MAKRKAKSNSYRFSLAYLLISISIILIVFIFYPVAKEEMKYSVSRIETKITGKEDFDQTPPNVNFSIVIPKIEAKAPVIKNIDPFNSEIFLKSLKLGVAHAKGTSLPDEKGNVYLFAHSTDAFYNVSSYNAVFYLIGKLDKGDEIKVYFENNEYIYKVEGKKVVNANDVKYLTNNTAEKVLTLQTCYPPGTTLKRLIVIAKQIEK